MPIPTSKKANRTEPEPAKRNETSFMISDEMPIDTTTLAPVEGQFHILVVHDDPDNRQVLVNQLSLQNYNVTAVANGIEALKLIPPAEQPFDLIILDMALSKMSGYKVCREIRRHYAATELPIIMLIAKDQPANLVAGFDSGANDCLARPFAKVELLARTKTHLQLANLRKLNTSKDKFFSIVSHDLRAPFMPLLGLSDFLSQMIAEDASPEEIKRTVGGIHRSAQNTYNLLENLLQWSMMQRGRMPYDPVEMQLTEWVNNTLVLLVENAEQKNIRLCNQVGEELMVYADNYMLTTIIRNLVSNALKFTKIGGEVTVSAASKGDFIEVKVADTGIGIKQEFIDKLFKLDEHHVTKGTSQERGTGLGLVMCKEMVEKNGGEIWIESKVGQGTTAYFTIPKYDPLDELE